MYIWLHNILNIILCFGFSNRVKFLKCDANMKFDKNLSSSEDRETKRALIRLYWYLESYSWPWDAFSGEYFEQYTKHYTYTSNTGQLLTLKPNGTVYTKTGGDDFVQLSCGFHNSIFQNTSRTPISECLWTRTIQSGKNSSSVLFTCKVRKIFSSLTVCNASKDFEFRKRK